MARKAVRSTRAADRRTALWQALLGNAGKLMK
jgi:hypothetical protein